MNTPVLVASLAGAGALLGSVAFVTGDVRASATRLEHPEQAAAAQPAAAVADHTEAAYCTPQFKNVLKRVLDACGLVGQEERRGCQPADVKTFAEISDDDFVALFTPLVERGAIVMFDDNSDKIDDGAKKLLVDEWEDRKGARYFFVVARASRTGAADMNRALSQKRANSVMFHLEETTKDPDLSNQVGMLWLGSEFAQLPKEYCDKWQNSRPGKPCNTEAINRSAFISWVDCRL